MVKQSLTIIIPAHNEERRLGPVLEAYLKYFGPATEFLIVPNACTDRTVALVESYARRDQRVHCLVVTQTVGKGGAILAGFRIARGQNVGYVDADGATSPAEFERLVEALAGADAVIASRWVAGSRTRRTLLRRFASLFFILCRQLIVPLPVRDTQCGAKVFARPRLMRVLPSLRVTDMAFDVELLAALADSGATIHEVPTVWEERGGSAKLSSFGNLSRTGWAMLRTLFSIRARRPILSEPLP